jgi:hypothetical protein
MRNIRPSKEGGVPNCFAIPNHFIFLINVVKIARTTPISPGFPKKVHTLRYLWPKAGNLNVLDFEEHSQEQTLITGPEPSRLKLSGITLYAE